VGIPWRLPFPVGEVPAPPGVVVEELSREEVPARLGESPEALDRLAPEGWRAFAAVEDGRVVASSCVLWTPAGPLLFRAHTPPEHRGRRLFALVARTIAWHLSREQVGTALRSSCARDNAPSIRAHEAAGFLRQENTEEPDV
jgi:hypothetical protein